MTLETMQAIKEEYNLSYKDISERSGVPLSTVQKVIGGITTPRSKTMNELETAFTGFVTQGSPRWLGAISFEELMLKSGCADVLEALSRYKKISEDAIVAEEHSFYNKNDIDIISLAGKKSGNYSVSDYEALPSDIKAELIDGYFYDMASPSKIHQTILIEMLFQIKSQIAENNGRCKVYIAPSDVQLENDDKTIVQPDLFIICKKDMIRDAKRTCGAPEFVVEVLSDSTRRKDMTLKLNKYMNAGVKEYWIVDPDKKYIIKYFFENMDFANIYTFEDTVPIEIYAGKIAVDFKVIKKEISDFDQ